MVCSRPPGATMQHLYKYSIALVAGLILIPFSGLGQKQEKFRARISPIPIDVAMQKVVAGTGAVTATLSCNKLTSSGVFEGMPSAATTAKIHRGLATGVRGSPFLDLTVTKATK